MEELCTDLREVLLMVRALCETEGIDVSDISQVTSETQDGQYQGHSPHTSEMSLGSKCDDGNSDVGESSMA